MMDIWEKVEIFRKCHHIVLHRDQYLIIISKNLVQGLLNILHIKIHRIHHLHKIEAKMRVILSIK